MYTPCNFLWTQAGRAHLCADGRPAYSLGAVEHAHLAQPRAPVPASSTLCKRSPLHGASSEYRHCSPSASRWTPWSHSCAHTGAGLSCRPAATTSFSSSSLSKSQTGQSSADVQPHCTSITYSAAAAAATASLAAPSALTLLSCRHRRSHISSLPPPRARPCAPSAPSKPSCFFSLPRFPPSSNLFSRRRTHTPSLVSTPPHPFSRPNPRLPSSLSLLFSHSLPPPHPIITPVTRPLLPPPPYPLLPLQCLPSSI